MRTSVQLRLLVILGVSLICTNGSLADLVVDSVFQKVEATATDILNPPDPITNETLPVDTFIVQSGTSAFGSAYADQTVSVGPSSIDVQTTTEADQDPLGFAYSRGFSQFLVNFTVDSPSLYSVSFAPDTDSTFGINVFRFSGPGISYNTVDSVSDSVFLSAGAYEFEVISDSLTVGAGLYRANATASLTAVPEPSAVVFFGLLSGAALSIKLGGRLVRRRNSE